MRRALLLLLPLLLTATVACGGSDSGSPDPAEPTTTSESSEGAAAEGTLDGVRVSGELGSDPQVQVDKGFSVDETTVQVLEEGDGSTVAEGDQVSGPYAVVNASTGKELDSSATSGQPISLEVSPQAVFPGLVAGLVGQSEGSRVAIAVPPAEGFGDKPNPQVGLQGDETLVFVIDIEQVTQPVEPLPEAEGEEQELPPGLPTLELDADGIPTGFSADADTEKTVQDLVVAPTIVGDGPELEQGQTATVHYVGQLYPDGKVFDESWSSGQPAEFPLQPGGLIDGFLEGLVGQTVGSRVVIAIPSEKGYGAAGQPPAIPPDSDLIFVVDILAAS